MRNPEFIKRIGDFTIYCMPRCEYKVYTSDYWCVFTTMSLKDAEWYCNNCSFDERKDRIGINRNRSSRNNRRKRGF